MRHSWPSAILRIVLRRTLPARVLGRRNPQGLAARVPTTDIEHTEDAIVFKLDMPNMGNDDVSIQVHGRTLTISGERREEKERNHEGYLARERAYGAFSRSFLLPEDINEDDITATFEYGQLKVSVPRPRVETPRTIEITTS